MVENKVTKHGDENFLFLCECSSTEHQIIFSTIEDFGETEVYAFIHLNPEYGLWRRICHAIRYIFGYRCKYGDFDEFIFRPEDWKKLDRIAKYLKAQYKARENE